MNDPEAKMTCGHNESVYRNWADDAPHYCIVCGLGQVQAELKAANLQISELREALSLSHGTVEGLEAGIEEAGHKLENAERLYHEMREALEALVIASTNMVLHQIGRHELSSCCHDVTPTPTYEIQKALEKVAKVAATEKPKNSWEPKDWTDGYGRQHDMWTGPCCCGAHHHKGSGHYPSAIEKRTDPVKDIFGAMGHVTDKRLCADCGAEGHATGACNGYFDR